MFSYGVKRLKQITQSSNNFIGSTTKLIMLHKTAYLNGLTKEKEIEIYMESHKNNLKYMKSINHNEPQINPIEINRNKEKYLRGRRAHEINIENEILTQKIQKIVNSSKNPKYHSSNQKYSKSLNGYIKRINQSQVNEENLKLLVRLEDSKPTYSTKKYLEDFQHLRLVEKKMSTAEFYLTDSPTFRKRKLNTNKSFLSRRNSSFGQNSSFLGEKNELVKETVTLNDGKMWEIKIFKDQKEVKITGEVIIGSGETDFNLADLKLISIPNLEANLFLRKHCDNRLDYLIKHLKVDQKDGSLMLIIPQNAKLPYPSKLMNPEQKTNIEKKLMNIEFGSSLHKRAAPRQIFNTANKKSLNEELPKFNSHKENSQKVMEYKKSEESIKKLQKKDTLPKLESKKNISVKKEEAEQKKQKEQKEASQVKIQKQNTKKGQLSSIKQNNNEKDNNKREVNIIQGQKESIQRRQGQQKIVANEEQENQYYQQQKFQESINKKNEDGDMKEQQKWGQIKEQKYESREVREQMKDRQGQIKEEQQIRTPIIQESTVKGLGQQKINKQMNK